MLTVFIHIIAAIIWIGVLILVIRLSASIERGDETPPGAKMIVVTMISAMITVAFTLQVIA